MQASITDKQLYTINKEERGYDNSTAKKRVNTPQISNIKMRIFIKIPARRQERHFNI